MLALKNGHLDVPGIESRFRQRFPSVAASCARVTPNKHASPGKHIYERFVKAIRDAPVGEVELYMHGTSESNVDLILESSLLKERCVSGPCFWFTPHLHDANNFMHGTKRLLVCAIICYYTGGQCGGYKDAVTIVDEAHVLPVLELQIA